MFFHSFDQLSLCKICLPSLYMIRLRSSNTPAITAGTVIVYLWLNKEDRESPREIAEILAKMLMN